MPDKVASAKKKRDKAENDFDQAQNVLAKAFHKYHVEKNADKKVPLLKHVVKACHEAIKAGEDCIDADSALEQAEKESEE